MFLFYYCVSLSLRVKNFYYYWYIVVDILIGLVMDLRLFLKFWIKICLLEVKVLKING